jgi:hypothetical protein
MAVFFASGGGGPGAQAQEMRLGGLSARDARRDVRPPESRGRAGMQGQRGGQQTIRNAGIGRVHARLACRRVVLRDPRLEAIDHFGKAVRLVLATGTRQRFG